MAENQYYAEKFVLLVVHVFIDSLFTLYLTYVSYIVIAGLWKFYCVSSNNTMWDYEWASTRRPVTNPVTGRPTSTRKPVTARIAMRKGGTGKEFTLTSWETEIAKCSRTEQLGLYARDAQVKPYLEQQNLGELITAEQWKLRLVNRETITDTLSWDKIWQLEDPWWNKTSWSRLGSHKSFTLTIPGIWH